MNVSSIDGGSWRTSGTAEDRGGRTGAAHVGGQADVYHQLAQIRPRGVRRILLRTIGSAVTLSAALVSVSLLPASLVPSVIVTLYPAAAIAGEAPEASGVVVNGVALSKERLSDCTRRYGLAIPEGRYWYDIACGAWGLEGGPALGITLAGVDLGASLRSDASGGGQGTLTGVFFNGRELHPYDVAALARLVPVYPGRYWIDAYGNAGFEGGPALVNLWQLANQSAGGGGGQAYQRSTAGGYIGGDGSTSYFFDPETGSSVMVGN